MEEHSEMLAKCMKYETREKSQEEIQKLLDLYMGTKSALSFLEFKNITETISSDIFLCVINT